MLASSLFLSACAHDEFADESAMQNAVPVPGEKTGDSNIGATAGPGGAGANVRW